MCRELKGGFKLSNARIYYVLSIAAAVIHFVYCNDWLSDANHKYFHPKVYVNRDRRKQKIDIKFELSDIEYSDVQGSSKSNTITYAFYRMQSSVAFHFADHVSLSSVNYINSTECLLIDTDEFALDKRLFFLFVCGSRT